MAIIKPFKGIRPPKELVEQVASRPYDVLNSEEAREEGAQRHDFEIISLGTNRPHMDLPQFKEAEVFIPFEATSALASLGSIKEVMKDEKKAKNKE